MITLQKTCEACPEQYDAFLDGRQVGYLRLRHGTFRVDCPDSGGETVLRLHPKGDGVFEPDEREAHLAQAVAAIEAWLAQRGDDESSATDF